MTYHNIALKDCEDFLHKVPKVLAAHPGWTVERGSIAQEVEEFLSFTASTLVRNGGDVREFGATTVFGDQYPDSFEYEGFAFTPDLSEHVGCQFINAKTIDSYRVTAARVPDETCEEWVLEYSDDGTAWVEADTRTGQSFAAGETKSFAFAGGGSHVFWRFRPTDPRTINIIGALDFLEGPEILTKTAPEYIFRAQGFGNFDDTLIGFHMAHNISAGQFAIRTSALTTIQPGRLHDFTGDDFVYTSLRNTPMDMHLVISERQFVAGIHLGGLDAIMYAGAFLPYADPTEYPYPLMLLGSTGGLAAASSTSNTTLTRRSGGSSKFRLPSGEWISFGSGSVARESVTPSWHFYPTGYFDMLHFDTAVGQPQSLGPNIFSLLPFVLLGSFGSFSSRDPVFAVGELEGIAWIPGDGVASGLEFTDSKNDNYRVFQSYGNADESDHCALRLS